MSRACPYCDASETEWIEAEGLFRCRQCQYSSLAGEDSSGKASSLRWTTGVQATDLRPRRAPGEGSSLRAAGFGLAATVVFYAALQLIPESALHELFAERGGIPYVITGISAWALCLLADKMIRVRKESSILAIDLLALPSGARLHPAQAAAAVDRIAGRPNEIGRSFLASRLIRALRYFEARRRVVEVVEHLSAESRADDLRVDASYSLVRVFVWAVPTLGFIGTVIGIGGAVGGFSEALDAAASLDGMKESIGSVTGGLGVAFDTTLLALVMSIVIMFPANAVQRMEEDLLTRVDDYCTQRLVQRLEDEEPVARTEAFAAAIAVRLAETLGDEAPATPSSSDSLPTRPAET